MKNYVGTGKTVQYTNSTGSDISAGDVVVVGAMLGVAAVDIANGAAGTVNLEGEFNLPKVDAADISQGDDLTWDVSAVGFDDNAATPATGDITGPAAVAMEAKGATTDETIRVKLTGVPGTVN